MQAWYRAFLDLLYPPRCLFCRRVLTPAAQSPAVKAYPALTGVICDDCRPNFPAITAPCPRCGAPEGRTGCSRCAAKAFAFSGVVAPAVYSGCWREVIHRFKYGGQRHLAAPLACLLQAALQERGLRFDRITCIPLSPQRQKERGYNQAALLARELARSTGIAFTPLLQRPLDRPPQTGLSRRRRRDNVQGAFKLCGKIEDSPRILLVDDVLTTGATADAAARVLLGGGAARVYIAAAARSL